MKARGRVRRGPRMVAMLLLAAVGLSGCAGVPRSSEPKIVSSLAVEKNAPPAVPGPPKGAVPRTIVQDFLRAATSDPSGHTTARKYLAPSVRRKWSDSTATIISSPSVSTLQDGTITVTGRVIGTLNGDGIFSPSLRGTGDGGPITSFPFKVGRVAGQSRITKLADGLLLTSEQFSDFYRQHAIYFLDQTGRYLIPDLRWSALSGVRLDNWLLKELSSGPRTDLRDVVSTSTLPVQASSRQLTVTEGVPLEIDVPGAAQLDAAAKRQLAAQLATTVSDPNSFETVSITDGGDVVPLPGLVGKSFSAAELYPSFAPPSPVADVFFLRRGDIVEQGSGSLAGALRHSPYFLSSIALTRLNNDQDLEVAGVTGNDRQLILGSQRRGYGKPINFKTRLSRPAWAPGLPKDDPPEVWIGAGDKLLRVEIQGNTGKPSQVAVPTAAGGGRILAVRLSPEGSRIALVIASADGQGQLYVGSVVRSAGQVRVDLQAISPDGVSVQDVGWIGTQKLIAIGSQRGTGEPQIFETNVDGSLWSGRSIGPTLPGAPDSVTVALGQLAWVSVNKTVWEQDGRSWTSPTAAAQTFGDKPVYLE